MQRQLKFLRNSFQENTIIVRIRYKLLLKTEIKLDDYSYFNYSSAIKMESSDLHFDCKNPWDYKGQIAHQKNLVRC
jgi:hypothetical protein